MASDSKHTVNRCPSPTAVSPSLDTALTQPTFPPRTQPDRDGQPNFLIAGKEGPPKHGNEKRRHAYLQEGGPVRVKLMLENGGALNWYRVQNVDGAIGWQAKKPQGFVEVPYVGGAILSIER